MICEVSLRVRGMPCVLAVDVTREDLGIALCRVMVMTSLRHYVEDLRRHIQNIALDQIRVAGVEGFVRIARV